MNFEGKAVLITGSTRGIGKVTARGFLERGARVAINGRTEESVAAAMAGLGPAERMVAVPGSVDTAAGCESVVGRALQGLGGLDILVNNAGIYPIKSIEETDEALWDSTMDLNLKGTFFCSRAALPALRAARGNIVNDASIAGLMGFGGVTLYCATRGGMVNLTRAMALELAPDVRVNCVCPTTVDTEMGRQEFDITDDPAAAFAAFEAASPMKRIAQSEDVADAMLFLASEEARYLTGVALPVDGGKAAGRLSDVSAFGTN